MRKHFGANHVRAFSLANSVAEECDFLRLCLLYQFGGIYALLPALVPLDRIGAQLMGAAVWLLGLSLLIGATDWAQRDLAVAAPKLIAALITWLACFWIVVQRRRQHLRGASFARSSLLVAIPAIVALYLSLPASR